MSPISKILVLIFTGWVAAADAQNITRPNIAGPSGVEVNSYTGNLVSRRSDLYVPGTGLSMDVSFTYNSADAAHDLGFGFGWSFAYGRHYVQDSAGVVLYNDDGRQDFYQLKNGSYIAPVGVFDRLTAAASGEYVLATKDGTQYIFGDTSSKKLTGIQDRNGNVLSLTYSGGNISRMADGVGRGINFTWSNGHLVSFKTDFGSPARTVMYTYNDAGCLTDVKDPAGNVTSYGYARNRVISTLTDKNRNIVSILYNGDGAVVKLVSCTAEKSITYNTGELKTYVTDQNGASTGVTTYGFDKLGRLISRAGNCCGFNVLYSYDDDNNLNQVTDANGNVTTYGYDKRGNLLSLIDPAQKAMTFVYDTVYNLVTGVTDKNGNSTVFIYDAGGNMLEAHYPLGLAVKYSYDNKGRMVSYLDKKGNISAFGYDGNGYLSRITDPGNNVMTVVNDAFGNITSYADGNGHASLYTYNVLDQTTKIVDAKGGVFQYSYDADGQVTLAVDQNNHRTQYVYDAAGNIISIVDPAGNTNIMTYDALDNVTSRADANGHTSSFQYDNLGRLIVKTNPAGESSTLQYDGKGNRIAVTYPNGNEIMIQYDALDRPTKISDKMGILRLYSYDAKSNKITSTDANGNTTAYKYDELDRMVKKADATGNSVQLEYDANNNLVKQTDKLGNSRSYTFDALDRLITSVDAMGNVTGYAYDGIGNLTNVKNSNNNQISYLYDELNRLEQESFPDNTTKSYSYDPAGNLLTRKDNSGSTITYRYDNMDRLIARIYNSDTDSLGYDPAGKMIQAKNKAASVIINYDNAGRVLSETLNGKATSYTYDIANGKRDVVYPSGRTIEEQLNVRNQLVAIVQGAGKTIVSLNYDATGLPSHCTYGNSTTVDLTFNSNGQMGEVVNGPNTFLDIAYSYDKNDNLISKSTKNNPVNSEQYGYDPLSELKSVSTISGQGLFNYDGMGNRISKQSGGQTIGYTVNNMNAYSSIVGEGSVNPTYDGNGNLTNDGTIQYSYDQENRIVGATNGVTVSYAYDALGRRVQKKVGNGIINYFYDGLQVVEERDGADTMTKSIVWGSWVDDIISFDKSLKTYYCHADRLGSVVAITDTSGKVVEQYQYDAFGGVSFFDGNLQPIDQSTALNMYTYTGREYDPEIGSFYFRARQYDPANGRFLQRDPLGYGPDNSNLYNYVMNDPMGHIDPYGLYDLGANTHFGSVYFNPDFGEDLGSQAYYDNIGKNVLNRNCWKGVSGSIAKVLHINREPNLQVPEARNAGNKLEQYGFEPNMTKDNFDPNLLKNGDVVIIQAYHNDHAGHAAIYYDGIWYSDASQANPRYQHGPGNVYPSSTYENPNLVWKEIYPSPDFIIYRYNPVLGFRFVNPR